MLSSPDCNLTLVTSHHVSLQCPTPMSIPAMLNGPQPPSIPAVPNHHVSLQCPTAKYPCSAQPLSILAVPNRKVSLQCPSTKYPCSAQPMSIPAVSNHQISLQCPTEKYPWSAQPQSIPGVPNSRVSIFLQRINNAARKTLGGGRETLRFLCNNGFRVGMLEVNNLTMTSWRPFGEWLHKGPSMCIGAQTNHFGL